MANTVEPCDNCKLARSCKVFKKLQEAGPEERWSLLSFVYEHSTAIIVAADEDRILLECPCFQAINQRTDFLAKFVI